MKSNVMPLLSFHLQTKFHVAFCVRASGEMADALASGASVRKDVGVQVPPRAPGVSPKKARRHPPISI